MNVSELRIGNWVSNIHDIPMIVKAIYEDTIYVDFKGNVGALWEFNKYEPFKPIELTEEILLKCGFEITKNDEYPFKYVINKGMRNEVEIEDLNSTTCFVLSHGRRFSVVKIEYLHQLQNLYYCLVGTELKIEL